MNRLFKQWTKTLSLAVAIPLMAASTFADSGPGAGRLATEVRHELLMLPYYGVFDNLKYSLSNDSVELQGEVTRPTLKTEAGNVVKTIEGVTQVKNNIEVLPLSSVDDQIRLAAFRAIYGDSALSTRYGYRSQSPIHIVVRNGHITLEGIVANEFDRNLANLRANGVPGVFSVTNNLRIDSSDRS